MKKRVLSFMLACFMIMSTFIIVPATVHAEDPVTQWTLDPTKFPSDGEDPLTYDVFTLKTLDRNSFEPKTTVVKDDATADLWYIGEQGTIGWQLGKSEFYYKDGILKSHPMMHTVAVISFKAPSDGVYSFDLSFTKGWNEANQGKASTIITAIKAANNKILGTKSTTSNNYSDVFAVDNIELKQGEELYIAIARETKAGVNNDSFNYIQIDNLVFNKDAEITVLADKSSAASYVLSAFEDGATTQEHFKLLGALNNSYGFANSKTAINGTVVEDVTYYDIDYFDLDENYSFADGENTVTVFADSTNASVKTGLRYSPANGQPAASSYASAIAFTAPAEGLYRFSQIVTKDKNVAGRNESTGTNTGSYSVSDFIVVKEDGAVVLTKGSGTGNYWPMQLIVVSGDVYLEKGESLYFVNNRHFYGWGDSLTGYGAEINLLSVTPVNHDCAAEDLTLVEAKAATCLETGISTAHYACGCGRTFLSADATNETVEDYTIAIVDHASTSYLTTSTEHWQICDTDGCDVEIENSRGYHTVTDGACTVCGWTVPSGANKVGITLVNTGEIKEGEKVTVNVVVADAYAASKIVINFNKTYLTFNEGESTLGDAEVVLGDGTITILDHGAVKDEAIDYVLVFDAILFTPDAEYATVDLVAAGFSTQEDAEVNNLGGAELDAENKNISTAIIKADHTVSFETGEVELNTLVSNPVLRAPDAKDYTFTVIAPENYTYTVTATMGGVDVDAANITYADGVYTVKNVLGDLVISVSRTPNVYENSSVTIPDGAVLPEGKTNPTSATYGTNFVFYIPADIAGTPGVNGTDYEISAVTVNGEAYDVAKVVKVSDTEYYVPGADIAGDVAVTVTATATDPSAYTVNYTADGFGGVSVESSTVAVDGTANAVLNIVPEMGYAYTVTATMGGNTATVVTSGNTYTIEGVTGNVMFTVTRAIDTSNLEVGETAYVQLNGTALWLITVESEKLPAGKIYTYGGQTMFYSEQYDAYCILVVSATRPEELETLAIVDGEIDGYLITEAEYASYDVNMTGLTDINDAQLVYNMYMANADETYTDFTANVTMEKYLRADTNGDMLIDVNDAAAIVNYLVG